MDAISQTTFSSAFSWMKMFEFRLKFHWSLFNNIPALVQIMALRRPGDKPLSEPMMVRLPTHICVTRPQWVNSLAITEAPWTRTRKCSEFHGNENGALRGWLGGWVKKMEWDFRHFFLQYTTREAIESHGGSYACVIPNINAPTLATVDTGGVWYQPMVRIENLVRSRRLPRDLFYYVW